APWARQFIILARFQSTPAVSRATQVWVGMEAPAARAAIHPVSFPGCRALAASPERHLAPDCTTPAPQQSLTAHFRTILLREGTARPEVRNRTGSAVTARGAEKVPERAFSAPARMP